MFRLLLFFKAAQSAFYSRVDMLMLCYKCLYHDVLSSSFFSFSLFLRLIWFVCLLVNISCNSGTQPGMNPFSIFRCCCCCFLFNLCVSILFISKQEDFFYSRLSTKELCSSSAFFWYFSLFSSFFFHISWWSPQFICMACIRLPYISRNNTKRSVSGVNLFGSNP